MYLLLSIWHCCTKRTSEVRYLDNHLFHFAMANTEDDALIEITELSGDQFFKCLEKQLKTLLPDHIKKILKMNGFCNALMMSKLVDSKIIEIEEFMRTEFASYMIPAAEKIDDYLGIYKDHQNKFKFLCGHKVLLEIMRDACKVHYTPVAQAKALSSSAVNSIDEGSENEIFQKLFDGVTTWLKGQGKFETVNIIFNVFALYEIGATCRLFANSKRNIFVGSSVRIELYYQL